MTTLLQIKNVTLIFSLQKHRIYVAFFHIFPNHFLFYLYIEKFLFQPGYFWEIPELHFWLGRERFVSVWYGLVT